MKKIISLLLAVALTVSLFAMGIEATTTNPVITSAVAINDTQFKITVSEPVTVKDKAYFALFVAKNGTIPNLTERDGRFGGSITPVNAASTEFTWTINDGGNAASVITSAVTAGHKVYFGINGNASSGMVDVARAVDAEGKGFIPNVPVVHGSHGVYGVEVKAFSPNAIVAVKALNDYELEISFVKPLTSFAGAVLFGVLNPDGTGIYNSDLTSTLDDHAVMASKIQDGKLDGHVIEATKLIPNWADGLYLEITGKPIVGELTATKCEIVGDNQVLVTFSAPVAIAKKPDGTDASPYVTMRLYNANSALLFWNPVTEEYIAREAMYDKDGKRVYKDLAGNYTTESEGKNENGEVVAYKAQSNTPMQWATTWEWGNKEHTKILYTFKGVKDMPANNLPDMLAYDWNQIQEGAFLGFDFEEKYDGVKIDNDNHVQNIFRADNPKICLDATFFPHNLDSVMWTLKEGMVWSYQPQNITAKAEVISDTQIRIAFSQAIDMEYVPFMGIRMVDKEGNLMWNGEPNLSSPYQWTGSWEWEDDSHRAIIWSMTGNGMLGGNTLYNLANWAGVLQKYKDEGNWKFCIEEKNRDGFYTIAYNGLIENIAAKGTNSHMRGNYGAGTSGVYMNLDMSELVGGAVTLISAKATDDQTIALTFSKPVVIDEGVTMGVRYLTPSGDSEVLADGRTAYFKGTWEYADDTKTVITWKLNSKHAKNLTDIIQFNGNFEWNKGARVAFVIMDEEGDRLPLNTLRINGVRDITELQHLTGNYKTKECVMSQLDIEVLYDLPSNAIVEEVIQYITNYLPFVLILSATSVCGLVVAVALGVKRKKSR